MRMFNRLFAPKYFSLATLGIPIFINAILSATVIQEEVATLINLYTE